MRACWLTQQGWPLPSPASTMTATWWGWWQAPMQADDRTSVRDHLYSSFLNNAALVSHHKVHPVSHSGRLVDVYTRKILYSVSRCLQHTSSAFIQFKWNTLLFAVVKVLKGFTQVPMHQDKLLQYCLQTTDILSARIPYMINYHTLHYWIVYNNAILLLLFYCCRWPVWTCLYCLILDIDGKEEIKVLLLCLFFPPSF